MIKAMFQKRSFARASWSDFKKTQGKFGQNREDSYRAEYEKEKKERTATKLNWGIKNRWEQRELEDVLKNKDVRQAQHRDLSKIQQNNYAQGITEFHSVDEIYFFMDKLFAQGFDEKQIGIALDVFLRDFGQFEEADLEKPTFKNFVRELGVNLITFQDQQSYVKAARFLDWYCIPDATLWVNLEQYMFKKENLFSPQSFIAILSHFSSQTEGSRDFYDFIEFQYNSQVFKKVSTHHFITLLYSFYSVHAGTKSFLQNAAEDLIERLDESTTTFDLLRVLQAYSEISTDFVKLFMQLEGLFLQRFEQMSTSEITTCASGFAISGYGSPYFNKMMEQIVMQSLGQFDNQSLKEIARGFVFSLRGSKLLLQMLMPRFQTMLHEFNTTEQCYLLFAYHDAGYVPKLFAQAVEENVKQRLILTEEITIQEIALIVKTFCTSRTAHRDFHKLLETTILMRMNDLKLDMKILHKIGQKFEESGLCSIDTLKALKKHAFQTEVENEVFK